jgi:hypothetical protein
VKIRLTLLSFVVAAGAGVALSTPAEATPVRVTNTPLIAVHGWSNAACPGVDARTSMSGLAWFLWNHGEWNRPYEAVRFYQCDVNGQDITNGSLADGNTSIMVLAKQLAWWVYNAYTSKGQTVELFGYSMGGLIVRWALYRESLHDEGYPPSLLVQDAVTVSTPHLGANMGSSCPTTMAQCAEMYPGSALLTELAAPAGQSPQATNGTDWTEMGGGPCDSMPGKSTTGMTGGHRISYYTSAAPCYNHGSYLWDDSVANDTVMAWNQVGWGNTYLSTTTGPHSLALLMKAIDTSAW